MEVPDSVKAYVGDPGIRRAARELLALGDGGVLDGLEWGELDRFYRAQLAARQLASEWAILGNAIWHRVWGGLLDRWTAVTPDDQNAGNYDAGLDLVSLLDTDDGSLWFGRVFTSGAWTFYATVTAVPGQGVKLKVSCAGAKRVVSFTDVAPAPDEIDNWVSEAVARVEGSNIDLADLRQVAAGAVATAEVQITQR